MEKGNKEQPVFKLINHRERAGFEPLPATRVEVAQIAALVRRKGWDAQTYLQEQALEETVKACRSPRVLHIATHGYFNSNIGGENNDKNPLLRSGLLLAGAKETFDNSTGGEAQQQVEDGVLTAYEAMNLHLDNTDLVVLSACETGLGEVKNGEGVYGLQRAFIVAGAKSLIFSLWKVDDVATQKLMSLFYKEWLRTGDKRRAFKKAQQLLREEYHDPRYWGAFVMIGS